ncbi:cytochrome P450 [Decorospora gaudefroyi]|uniref:Cytochrome P450 n=1 Tax=Decorospora gaudefroyi TaxID=184978 RepID=A0A6A5K622_9PLEO|nr:cytochrome P450 [Decorospora gaudefroyi]
MAKKPEPQLPLGSSSTLRGLTESFSFHSSPESFITSRILAFHKEHPDIVDTRAVVRAKVLNRNVAIVSSHAQIQQVLANDAAGYEAGGAYDELMAPFFPSPNLLLTDGGKHEAMRRTWEERMGSLKENVIPLVHQQTTEHFSEPSTSEIDLYDSMKTLSWKILLGTFLGLEHRDKLFETTEGLQENLLRGQFSLFPVTVNTGFWHSPRKKGKEAKRKLQAQTLAHFKEKESACPFATTDDGALEDIANHSVLFTSSLAVKALASILTALVLNLYLYSKEDGRSLAESLASESDPGRRSQRLRSILLETERLSPPIVGVMRRSTRENIIPSTGEQADVKIPKGWDCWLYFVGGGRDPAAFGSTWDAFDPERYINASIPQGAAFGSGPKACLGRELIREIALAMAETCIGLGIRMQGNIAARGVRGWLGWEPNDAVKPADWAQDMKQLPTQRPSEPVMVRVARS